MATGVRNMATIGELVLVYVDERPGFFARIDDISPDVKKGWWQVKLLVLTMPLQVYTWTLDTSQVDGAPFTMGGTPIRLEKVVSPVAAATRSQRDAGSDGAPEARTNPEPNRGKIVSLADRKREK
jgi:hypothetical protein